MAERSTWLESLWEDEQGPFVPRRERVDRSELDITPMIDITFLLLIFFLVATVPDPQVAAELPPARHGEAVGSNSAVILTVGAGPRETAPVYLADGKQDDRRLSSDPGEQAAQIREAVEQGLHDGKIDVLIKAESDVAHRDVARVAAAASQVPGIKLHIAVLEID